MILHGGLSRIGLNSNKFNYFYRTETQHVNMNTRLLTSFTIWITNLLHIPSVLKYHVVKSLYISRLKLMPHCLVKKNNLFPISVDFREVLSNKCVEWNWSSAVAIELYEFFTAGKNTTSCSVATGRFRRHEENRGQTKV